MKTKIKALLIIWLTSGESINNQQSNAREARPRGIKPFGALFYLLGLSSLFVFLASFFLTTDFFRDTRVVEGVLPALGRSTEARHVGPAL